jgi:hypothetical protein
LKLSEIWVFPFLLQGLSMMVDEFYYHRKRGLPKWERVGHPIDTLSVIACYLFLQFFAPTAENGIWYTGLCLFSCLLVTKDEFEHRKYCSGGEQWLHAVLFILHPLVFLVAGWIWYVQGTGGAAPTLLVDALRLQFYITLGFLIYQITYWNIIWKTNP